MGDNPRRPSFRLPWGDTSDSASTDPAADESTADAAPDDSSTTAEAADAAEAAPQAESVEAAEATPAEPEPPRPESAQFLRELVDAMRNVAESSRDTSLAELRTALDARVEQLKGEAAARAEEIRRRSEHDITGIGEWERTEIDRVRAEAEQRREARRAQLEQQLADHQSAADRDVEGTRRKLADHERAVAAFFAELAEIKDPAVFVATVKRMPTPPDLGSPNGGDAAPAVALTAANGTTAPDAPTGDDALTQRLAQLDEQLAATPSEPQPAEGSGTALAATATTAASPAAVTENGETSTPIVVKGLGSFGAITSFKQALERVEGIRGVTLSLGPTGEFVYRANHAAAFDIVEAIRKIEGPGAGIEEAEGSILVTVGHQR